MLAAASHYTPYAAGCHCTPSAPVWLQTMQQNDPMLVALAAVFLASKSENHGSARLQQIIGWFFKIKYAKDKEMATKVFAMMSNPQQNEWLRDIVLKVRVGPCWVLSVYMHTLQLPAGKGVPHLHSNSFSAFPPDKSGTLTGYHIFLDCTLQAERALLYVLGFRFQVDQPTAKLLQFATKYKLDSFYKVTLPNGPKLSQVCAAHRP